MQEKLPPVFFRYESYPEIPVFCTSNDVYIAHAQAEVLSCNLSCAFVASIKALTWI